MKEVLNLLKYDYKSAENFDFFTQYVLIDIDINIFKIVLIDINIFQQCQYIDNQYFISIYRRGIRQGHQGYQGRS